MKRLLLLLGLLLVVALAACEDTTVHTTPPAPIDSAGTPTLTIDPPTIGPNTPITVTGQGFPAGVVVELTVQRITESFTTDPLGQGQRCGRCLPPAPRRCPPANLRPRHTPPAAAPARRPLPDRCRARACRDSGRGRR